MQTIKKVTIEKILLTIITTIIVAIIVTTQSPEYKAEIKQIQQETHLPADIQPSSLSESEDGTVVHVTTQVKYTDANVAEVYAHMNQVKKDGKIVDFDINSYQNGAKRADDYIAIIIEK